MSRILLAAAGVVLLCQCGGGGNRLMPNGGMGGGLVQSGGAGGITTLPPVGANSIAVTVDPGPQNIGYTNGLFASVTLCVPGTTTCQTFDHLLVDTGSVGVRVLESELTLPLPSVTSTNGQPLAECTPFVDGTAWGPLRMADVTIGEELAANLPIQLIGEVTYPMPAGCTGSAITDFKTLAANGIVGVGVYVQDCGAACAPQPLRKGPNVGLYYACSSSRSCAVADVPLAQQVAHPVAAFPVDNNGTIIQLPSIGASGAPSVPGVLTFGIGTQANNGLGSAVVLDLDKYGFVSTSFNGTAYSSFLDSGSNGLFFLDAATSKLKQCTGGLSSFYCPNSLTNLSATLSSSNGTATAISFNVTNAAKLSASAYAFSNLAGPMPGFINPPDNSVPSFDWGLPFYFGRAVYTGIEDSVAGTGPYFAF